MKLLVAAGGRPESQFQAKGHSAHDGCWSRLRTSDDNHGAGRQTRIGEISGRGVRRGKHALAIMTRVIPPCTARHSSGDNDLILYLGFERCVDVTARSKPGAGRLGNDAEDRVNAKGDTVADYANGPRMNSLLFPDTVALLEDLGSANSHDCRSELCVLNTRPDKKSAANK